MKEKIYYFQEKSNDILDLQDDFTAEEIGMLFILKAAYFKYSGELKEENLCQRCKFFGDKEKLILLTKKIFCLVDGVLTNQKWLAEISGIKERSEKRANAANTRWGKTKKPKKTPSKPQVNPLLTPNENENPKSQLELKLESIKVDYGNWVGFVEMRKRLKKPLTEKAEELIIKKLSEFEAKQQGFANKALENSIANSWQGVFEPKDYQLRQEQKPTQSSGSYLDFLTGGKNV